MKPVEKFVWWVLLLFFYVGYYFQKFDSAIAKILPLGYFLMFFLILSFRLWGRNISVYKTFRRMRVRSIYNLLYHRDNDIFLLFIMLFLMWGLRDFSKNFQMMHKVDYLAVGLFVAVFIGGFVNHLLNTPTPS